MSLPAQTYALVQAARLAGFAPSIHNTQPWHWRVQGASMDLVAERTRQLAVTDPEGRMLTISCGAALHHVRVALAAEGWAFDVERRPDRDERDLLARLHLAGTAPVRPETMRLLQTMRIRRTDRRPVAEIPVTPESVAQIRWAAEAEGARLHLLQATDIVDLAAAADQAQRTQSLDPTWTHELTYWAGGARAGRIGVPDASIPSHAPLTTVPGRDFGHGGSLPVGTGHDREAVYAILYGDEDATRGWLRGGEALSALWLAAIELDLTVLPLSAAVEVPRTRQALRGMLSGVGEPYLALRLGVADPDHGGPPHTPRLPADQVVEVVGGLV